MIPTLAPVRSTFLVKRRKIREGRAKKISVNWGQIWPANTVIIRMVFVKTNLDQNVHFKETSTSNHIP